MPDIVHRQKMLQYLERDINNARSHDFILGIKVTPRHDIACSRKSQLCGVFLPEEVPDLYPPNCDLDACCCTNRQFVFDGDGSDDEERLKARRSGRTYTPPPPIQFTISKTEVEPELDAFTYADIRVMRDVMKANGPSNWDKKGHYAEELGYDPALLLSKMVGIGWIRYATNEEKIGRSMTVEGLKELLRNAGLPLNGDKRMLIKRVAENIPNEVDAQPVDQPIVVVCDVGRKAVSKLNGQMHLEQLREDFEQRSNTYQKLVDYGSSVKGSALVVQGNPWSTCQKLTSICGVFNPSEAPTLPAPDCPYTGRKPCACWNAYLTTYRELGEEDPDGTDKHTQRGQDIDDASIVVPTAKYLETHDAELKNSVKGRDYGTVLYVGIFIALLSAAVFTGLIH